MRFLPPLAFLASFVLPIILYSIEQGYVKVPLPRNAAGYFVEPLPVEDFPPKPRSFEEYDVDNTTLGTATRLFENKIHGSESVVVAKDGTLYLADKFAEVWRAHPNAAGSYDLEAAPFAYLGAGRPLGVHLDHDGNLIVCDTIKGLLKVNTTDGRVELLATQVTEGPAEHLGKILYANDLDIAKNGKIYFSASQAFHPIRNELGFWDTLDGYMLGTAGGRHAGKLLEYDPATRSTKVLLTGLWFSNGVALSEDESFVLVVETVYLRLHRYWLKGPKAGTSEVVLDRLPAFPDGLQRARDGGFWVSMVAPLLGSYKLLGSRAIRSLMAWLPASLRPKATPQGIILKVSSDLKPQKLYLEPTGKHVAFIASSMESNGRLFLGNLVQSYVSVVQL